MDIRIVSDINGDTRRVMSRAFLHYFTSRSPSNQLCRPNDNKGRREKRDVTNFRNGTTGNKTRNPMSTRRFQARSSETEQQWEKLGWKPFEQAFVRSGRALRARIQTFGGFRRELCLQSSFKIYAHGSEMLLIYSCTRPTE